MANSLKPIADLDDSMINLPLYQVPDSVSHYLLKTQLKLHDLLFPLDVKEEDKCQYFKKIQDVEENIGIDLTIDIVMNHTSSNSEMIVEHQEVGFNLKNTPHLNHPDYVDEILQDLSEKIRISADMTFFRLKILKF